MMGKKAKGSVAELIVSARLMEQGWRVLVPIGENTRYDLVAEKSKRFVRMQVKFVTPKNGALHVNCRSSNNWSVLPYTAEEIDAIAAYDAVGKEVYFIPVRSINKSLLNLRLVPAANRQRANIHFAEHYKSLENV